MAGDPAFTAYAWLISPCDNPYGYVHNQRETESGIDLNRIFDAPTRYPESAFIASSVAGVVRRCAIDLHEDDESAGFYLWERRSSNQPALGPRIIERVSAVCPINRTPMIENHANHNGVITLLDRAPTKGWTRGHYLGECLILETPAQIDLRARVNAHLEAIRAVLTHLGAS